MNQQAYQVILNNSKKVKNVIFFNDKQILIVVCMSDVFFCNFHGDILKTIKRLSPPMMIYLSPCEKYLVIHFADNYAILYDTIHFQPVEILKGIPRQIVGLKFSKKSKNIICASNSHIFLWNMRSCQIQSFSSQWRQISAVTIDDYGDNFYFGNFKGQITFVKRRYVPQFKEYVLEDRCRKIHANYVVEMQMLENNQLLSIGYNYEIIVTNLLELSTRKIDINKKQIPVNLPLSVNSHYIFIKNQKNTHCIDVKKNKEKIVSNTENIQIKQVHGMFIFCQYKQNHVSFFKKDEL